MNKSKGAAIIQKLAKEHGVSEKEIRDQIQIAIDLAIANPDSKKQKFWRTMLHKGVKPTPEDVIIYIANQIMNNNK